MNRENFAKWIEALRSGEYKQCRDRMESGGYYCCLAVGCEVAKAPYSPLGGYPTFASEIQGTKNSFGEWLGLKTEEIAFYRWCARMNDNLMMSFVEIANALEKYIETGSMGGVE